MIELRWVTQYNDVGECIKNLQYRQQIDTKVYAGMGTQLFFNKDMQWSKWIDVPEIGIGNADK